MPARELRGRLAEVAAGMLGCDVAAVRFFRGPGISEWRGATSDSVRESCAKRPIASECRCSRKVTIARPIFITIRKTGRGAPFHYFAYAAAVSEVEVDGFTGDYRLLRTDILEDVGDSVSPLVDRGQIEGGFIQGVGWLTLEELVWDAQGPPGHRGRVHL